MGNVESVLTKLGEGKIPGMSPPPLPPLDEFYRAGFFFRAKILESDTKNGQKILSPPPPPFKKKKNVSGSTPAELAQHCGISSPLTKHPGAAPAYKFILLSLAALYLA